ncbi:MAG: AMP-binding protein [Actinobacteria bacterium]|nr:AMP-binding protein [Actinomycetota bacterium]
MDLPRAVDPEADVHRASGLLRGLGLATGDRVLTILEDSTDSFALGLACMLEGVVQVPVHHSIPPREAVEIVADARPRLALVSPAASDAVPDELDVHVVAAGDLDDVDPVEPDASWPLTRPMAYTSGTTGRRKGVYVGLHDESWGRQVVRDEHDAFDRRHGERHLVVSPLHHSGPFRFAFVTWFTGGHVAVLPGFDAERWLATIREVRPTSMFCVPTHLYRLLERPDLTADDLASFQLIAHAGAPCPVPLKERLLEVAPDDAVWEFYGSTEGQFTVCSPDVWREAPGTVGAARPGRELEIREPGQDGVGTVWVRAPEHARWEYWGDPERTAEVWDGARFTVGDLGRLDAERRLFLHGRPGDLVISGGVNVYPAEVERRLLEHPAVGEVVVFGVPDEEWGERVVAAVVPRADRDPHAASIQEHAREGLQAAETPKQVLVVDELPKTSTGKTRRTGLAEHFGLT